MVLLFGVSGRGAELTPFDLRRGSVADFSVLSGWIKQGCKELFHGFSHVVLFFLRAFVDVDLEECPIVGMSCLQADALQAAAKLRG